MRSLVRLSIAFFLLANLLMMGAVSLHVIRTPERFEFVPKSQLTLMDTYVDTRIWTANDLKTHAALVQRLAQAGKQDVLSHVTAANVSSRSTELSTERVTAPKDSSSSESQGKSIFDFGGEK